MLGTSYRVDHLKDQVRPEAVPEALKEFLEAARQIDVPAIRFTYDGFILTEDGQTTEISPTLDVPDISHPVAAAYDKEVRRMFGVTLGGEGFVYQYNIDDDQWSILASMEDVDAAGMIYDADTDQLVFGLGLVSSGIAVYDLQKGELSRAQVDVEDLTGFTDLYDPGNGPAADIVPIAISGNLLLVRAGGSRAFGTGATKSRTYLIDLTTGEATLVAFNNGD